MLTCLDQKAWALLALLEKFQQNCLKAKELAEQQIRIRPPGSQPAATANLFWGDSADLRGILGTKRHSV